MGATLESLEVKIDLSHVSFEWFYQCFGFSYGITCHVVDKFDIFKIPNVFC